MNRNGTAQQQRFIDALDPNSVQLIDLSMEDWFRFAIAFARKLNYFGTETNEVIGSWESFFIQESEIEDFTEKLNSLESHLEGSTYTSDVKVHLTLFAAFLKLISHSQDRINKLSSKHLDFYYGQILKLDKKTPVADNAHILFELAKNAANTRIKEGTELDGGKDSSGQKRIYKTVDEIIVNNAVVSSLRNVYPDQAKGIKNSFVANSFDGLGGEFTDESTSWWPFGHNLSLEEDENSFPELPMAKTGFGLSSPVLLLKEGKRTITFDISLGKDISEKVSISNILDSLQIFLSGEKEWLPGTLDRSLSGLTTNQLSIVVTLDESADPIVAYDKEVLLEPYNTTDPVARFLLNYDADNSKANELQELFSKTTVSDINITVEAEALQDVVVENDKGAMDASKPFFPFGTLPVAGSNFYIGLPEALEKNWQNITVDFSWKDKPDDFRELYIAYREPFLNAISKEYYDLKLENGTVTANSKALIVENDSHFTADVNVLQDGVWKPLEEYQLFDETPWDISVTAQTKNDTKKSKQVKEGYAYKEYAKHHESANKKKTGNSKFPIKPAPVRSGEDKKFSASIKEGFIRITLKQSFLHKLFTKIYTVALSKTGNKVLIPNEPYTPVVESMKVSYSAIASYEEIGLFHEHPFGVSEESIELKKASVLKASRQKITLLPSYDRGSLFVGIENAEARQQINLLIQVLEGSENPETTNDFAEGELLEWFALCNNEWLPLNTDYILNNNTDNLLKTGIVSFSVPVDTTQDNTKMPEGFLWLKVETPRDFDTSSQLIDIKAQAVLAQFEDNDNSLDHLQYGLAAGTISKFVERLSTIKGVSQDFNSFDGVPQETDAEYYRRISERLRHKQRAITLWDYENLILQEFTDLYKANCLNHTSLSSSLAPGDVTVVVIPNIIQKNVYDSYKPRISKARRNEIKDFINKLNTLHVTTEVINPVYQEVKVVLKVKFYEGYDDNFYTDQLKQDIAKFLSPWAFEETTSIDFGLTLHESMMINYVEELSYVDYISDFELQQEKGKTTSGETKFEKVKQVIPEAPKVILTSVKYTDHDITAMTPSDVCTKKSIESTPV